MVDFLFLDTLISRCDNGNLDISVYRKSTRTDRYLDFNSHHDKKQKISAPNTLSFKSTKVRNWNSPWNWPYFLHSSFGCLLLNDAYVSSPSVRKSFNFPISFTINFSSSVGWNRPRKYRWKVSSAQSLAPFPVFCANACVREIKFRTIVFSVEHSSCVSFSHHLQNSKFLVFTQSQETQKTLDIGPYCCPKQKKESNSFVKSIPTWPPWRLVKTGNTDKIILILSPVTIPDAIAKPN